MRSLFLIIIFSFLSLPVIAGDAFDNSDYSRKVFSFYSFNYDSNKFVWEALNPHSKSIILPDNYFNMGSSIFPKFDYSFAPLIRYYNFPGEIYHGYPVIWLKASDKYYGYFFDGKKLISGMVSGILPTTEDKLGFYRTDFYHPEELANPDLSPDLQFPNSAPPDPEPDKEVGEVIDYRPLLVEINNYSLILSSIFGLFFGLYLWRLVILSRSQKEL